MLSVPAILPAKSKIYTSPKTYLNLNFLKLSSFGLLIVKSTICVTKSLFESGGLVPPLKKDGFNDLF